MSDPPKSDVQIATEIVMAPIAALLGILALILRALGVEEEQSPRSRPCRPPCRYCNALYAGERVEYEIEPGVLVHGEWPQARWVRRIRP